MTPPPSPRARRRAVARIGAPAEGVLAQVQEICALWAQAGAALPRAARAEAVRQTFELGNRSLFFVAVVMGFVGAIMVVHACTQALRITGDLTIIGPNFLQLLIREFGPTLVALMIAARYGAGVAAQIATMQVTEQVDALRLSGADPVVYLVAPRLWGGLCGMLAIAVFGTGIAFVAGGFAARLGFGLGWDTYFRVGALERADVAVGVAKAVAYGVAVPVVSAWAGLGARGGASGVGRATTRAVIGSSIAVLLFDFAIGMTAYFGWHE